MSDAHSTTSTETDYAAKLRRIPGFENYSYHGSGSLNQDSNIDSCTSRYATQVRNASEIPHHKHVKFQSSTLNPGSVVADVPNAALSQLKDISRKRELLSQLDSQVKSIHRKLANLRQELSQEICRGDALAKNDLLDTRRWVRDLRRYQRHLHRKTDEIARAEEELEPLQSQLTRAHFDVKTAEDDLYASFAGGARPGDSDASHEDRIFSALVLGLTDHDDAESSEHAYSRPPPPYNVEHYSTDQESHLKDTSEGASGQQRAHSVSTGSRSRQLSPLKHTNPRRNSQDTGKASRLERAHASKHKRSSNINTEIIGIGYVFPADHDLVPLIEAGSQDRLLRVAQVLQKVRKTDFETFFGYDVNRLDSGLNFVAKMQEERELPSVAQKLANIRVDTIHKAQLVSLWGRQMSQNAILEAWRTYAHGRHTPELLNGRGKRESLLRLVQNVRNLEVPMDLDDASNDRLITVGTFIVEGDHNSSINVQPSGKSYRVLFRTVADNIELDHSLITSSNPTASKKS